jgi:hypothetical protein
MEVVIKEISDSYADGGTLDELADSGKDTLHASSLKVSESSRTSARRATSRTHLQVSLGNFVVYVGDKNPGGTRGRSPSRAVARARSRTCRRSRVVEIVSPVTVGRSRGGRSLNEDTHVKVRNQAEEFPDVADTAHLVRRPGSWQSGAPTRLTARSSSASGLTFLEDVVQAHFKCAAHVERWCSRQVVPSVMLVV